MHLQASAWIELVEALNMYLVFYCLLLIISLSSVKELKKDANLSYKWNLLLLRGKVTTVVFGPQRKHQETGVSKQ